MSEYTSTRTLAIIAHVDHGKTTLVDSLFRQGGVYGQHQEVTERAMDSMDQERERGITILAKCTSVVYDETRLQLVDTPGHADFGGEVERSLRMVDGALLLVDAAEGPLPQTRFVLRKAFAQGLKVVVAINKIDRADARPLEVQDEVLSLFIDVGASDEQLECPVLFTDGRAGTATTDLEKPGVDLKPLVKALQTEIPPFEEAIDAPFCLQVNQLAYDPYVGRLLVGRVQSGELQINQPGYLHKGETSRPARVANIFRFAGPMREPCRNARAGDIVALAGMDDVGIGDVLSSEETLSSPPPPIEVDEPAVSMVFQVNDGPLAGKSGGKFVTSRHIKERLEREAFANVSIRIEPGEGSESFRVLGRGELQLAVLIEAMRREGYEFCVRRPQVVTRQTDEGLMEPLERLVIDIPAEHIGNVTPLLAKRLARLQEQEFEGDRVRLRYQVPTRGLFGLRSQLMTASRGAAIAHAVIEGWVPWSGDVEQRQNGALVADRAGTTTPYALFNLQPRGNLSLGVGREVYEGMVIGEHCRDNDLNVNCVREKKLTNVRASGKDDATAVSPHRKMSLEDCLEWIRDDEMVEVTPESIRLRKLVLGQTIRQSMARSRQKA